MSTIPTISTRVTTKKEKNEEQFELKQRFILRMSSSEYARCLRQLIDYGNENICQRLFIDLNSERRRDRIKFDNTRFKVTPPLKNVRKRHFRKVDREKTEDRDEIADYDVIDLEWEVIYDDDQQIEVNKSIEINSLEDTDLFGDAISELDGKKTSQKGLS
ncbi:unnamed protein product [Rotaria sordida]|uniref:Uncharacterized protein n=1 Tax=Rotaria sordida TaxID=392033 RepID=A0A819R560_9BILA|nr:unnamed protein product [Rotaria sordida]CAF1347432.1 unnamed protein product [Rotaria sordida]CAF4041420.1 unnamed protein product [Rotaria sordida]CAF4083804.1 unnamed protein product [Rotaria sordida]